MSNSIFKKYGSRNSIGLIAGIMLVVFGTWGQIQGTANDELSEPALQELFNTVYYHVKNDYVETESSEKLMFGAIRGMLEALEDPHTRFMTPDQFKELQVETRGNFGGLGIEISMRDNILTVVSPIEGTPAMRVGLKPGDKIVEIDKESTRGMSLMEAVKKMRGTPGTSVNISVARTGEDELLYFDIVREIIKIQVVSNEILEDKIGYVKLKQFSQSAARDLAAIIENYKKKKVKGLILDLRWNPGGLLDAAHKIGNFFISDGVIVSTRGRKPELDRVFAANKSETIAPDLPVIVLVNEGSASASEIVTGAIKDHKRGIVIGEKTFGKGSVQNVIPLRHNTAIALTIQKYYTPSGTSIHKKGIKPDIEVKVPEFTKTDRRNFKTLREKKILQQYADKNPGYDKANVQKFMEHVKAKHLELSEYAATMALRDEYYKTRKRPLVDLATDSQLIRAIEEMKKKI